MGKKVELLENHPYFFTNVVNRFYVIGEFDAIYSEVAFLVFFKPVNAANEGGFSRARGAANHNALALFDVKINIAQHMKVVAIPFVDFVEGNDGFRHKKIPREMRFA
jgi:hypothetical protein